VANPQLQPQLQPQRVNLYAPIVATPGSPPLALRVGITRNQSISEGVPMASTQVATYVLLSALPEELRKRVELAVQMLVSQQ
jgi:hypothetical protein